MKLTVNRLIEFLRKCDGSATVDAEDFVIRISDRNAILTEDQCRMGCMSRKAPPLCPICDFKYQQGFNDATCWICQSEVSPIINEIFSKHLENEPSAPSTVYQCTNAGCFNNGRKFIKITPGHRKLVDGPFSDEEAKRIPTFEEQLKGIFIHVD